MRRVPGLAALAALGATLLMPLPALAWGALAVSQGDDGAWAYGLVVGRASRAQASEDAMRICRNERYGQNCRLISAFSGRCIALAVRDGGNGYGYATHQAEAEARANARESCLESNPSCTISASRCDPPQ